MKPNHGRMWWYDDSFAYYVLSDALIDLGIAFDVIDMICSDFASFVCLKEQAWAMREGLA